MGNSYPGIHRLAVRGRRLPELRHPGPLFTGVRRIGILRSSVRFSIFPVPFGSIRLPAYSRSRLAGGDRVRGAFL
jgi:hypothetical protein